jgi:hypothetical protein
LAVATEYHAEMLVAQVRRISSTTTQVTQVHPPTLLRYTRS